MDRATLQVQPRTIVGKKVKQLRRQGVVPGHVFGHNVEPLNVAVTKDLLRETYRHSGDTGLVDLQLEDKTLPVLIQAIQTHAVTGDYLNVDFHKVNLKEKVTVSIPIVPVGEPQAVEAKIGVLEQPLVEIEIEALPTDLIEDIEYDVSALTNIDDAVYVKDLKVPATVTIVGDEEKMDEMVFKIGPLVSAAMEAAEAEAEAEEAAAAEAAAEEATEAGEGAQKTEGEEGEAASEESGGEEAKPEEKSEE